MVKPMTGQYWRQFLKIDDINFCALTRNGHRIDLIREIFEIYSRNFPNMPLKCPIEKKIYSAKNVTLLKNAEGNEDNPMGNLSPQSLPNGIYRHVLKFYNKDDLIGITNFWHIQLYDKMGEDRL